MKALQPVERPVRGAQIWPLSVAAYHALGEAGLIPKIEICVSSHEYDRAKLRAYARAGLKECWLVLGPEQQIEVHRRPAGDQFAERSVHGPGGRLISATFAEFSVELDALFAR